MVINKRKGGNAKGRHVKKSKKGEVNYCPDPPEGQSPENIEEKHKLLEVEMLKKDPDHQLVEDLMVATFSQRRKEIIGDQPFITDIISRWPALFHERQVVSHNSSSQNIPQRDRKHVVRYCTVSYSEICLTDIFYLSVSLLRSRQNSRELSPQTFWNLFSMGLMGWSQDFWRYTKQQLSLERSSHSKKF